jgi:hypothetical protein
MRFDFQRRCPMHHRRPRTIVIDCDLDDLNADADKPIILLQKVEHASRVHLDIESDDLEAEATRLEQLGTQRVALVRGRWSVMQAPSGHRYCVVHPQRETFGPHLNRWA